MLLNRINPIAFIISFSFGILMCYITSPVPNIVIKYPTPENTGLLTYIDKVSNCYQYKAIPVKCPTNTRKIEKVPLPPKEKILDY